jgi:hypothetical protein
VKTSNPAQEGAFQLLQAVAQVTDLSSLLLLAALCVQGVATL